MTFLETQGMEETRGENAELILGVLQCARGTCGFRVTGVTESYCCQACEDASGDEHDDECLQIPLVGFSMEHRSERGFTDYQQFSGQLRKLLAEKGPQHVGSLPHVWDAEYGTGTWAKSRPVKSASKACTYSSGVKVLEQVVYRLEDPWELSEADLETAEANAARFGGFSPEVMDVLSDEFELLEHSYQVSTFIATVWTSGQSAVDLRGGRLWCCRLSLRELKQKSEQKGEVEDVLSEPEEVLLPEQTPEYTSVGYGHSAESALSMARLHVLEEMDRWDPTDLLPRLRQLEKQLQDCASDMVHPQVGDKVDGEWHEDVTLRPTLEEFVDLMENLLLKPAPKSFVVWRLLARSWPYILAFAQEDCLEKLRHAMCMSSRACGLGVWLRMAEAAAYQYHRNILEMLQEVPLQDEHLPTVAYCRHQLFNLLLELREQILQELERGTRTQFISFHWGLGQAGFTCTLSEALKGKVDAIYLTAEENVSFVAEAVDENRFVIRAIDKANMKSLCLALQTQRMWCRPMAIYATIAARQREALKNLANSKAKVAFCPILKGAIIESWAASQMIAMDAESCANQQEILEKCEEQLAIAEQWVAPEDLMSKLSSTQKQAVGNAMSRRCSLVRGPPGTGKTHVAAAVALAASKNLPEKERILCVTQSHAAAMNLHNRLESFGVAVARVGTTLTPTEVVQQSIFQKVKDYWGEDDDEVSFMEIASEAGDFTGVERSKDLQKNQFAVMRRMVLMSNVAVMTLASSGNAGLLSGMASSLPMLVIDEAAQVVEPGPWVPLTWGCQRLVLVGDEKQLPATVLNSQARDTGLGVSLFERLVTDKLVSLGNGLVQLDEQQRMHPSIAEFPSRSFYDGTLTNGPDTLLRQKIEGFPWPNPELHVAFVECGAMAGEEGGRSHANPKEADALMVVLEHCLRQGLRPQQVGVITGYSAQQDLLRRQWAALAPQLGFEAKDLRVDTVDGFQGAERDLILASTVRSFFEVGFMRDPRRANVMLTRARRGLIVFGNGPTLQTEVDTWKPWIEWVKQRQIEIMMEDLLRQLDPGRPPRPDSPEEEPLPFEPMVARSVFPPIKPNGASFLLAGAGSNTEHSEWPTRMAAPEPREARSPQEQWLNGEAGSIQEEKAPAAATPMDEWEEFVDPKTGKIWLWNEVTGESKWKN